jgi:hypothetical protein
MIVANFATCVQALTQDGEKDPPGCAADDLACQILEMKPKPGGGGGGGITDGFKQEQFNLDLKKDLGTDRLPSEQMRLPDTRDMLNQKGPVF